MKLLKQALAVLGTVVLVAMIAALVAPKAVHALVATAVQVVNTSANPVPTQVVNTSANPVPTLATDAQTAFVASSGCLFGGAPDHAGDACEIEPLYTVPIGKIAVIESASGVCVTSPPSTIREFQLQFSGPGGSPAQLSLPPSPAVLAVGASTAFVPIDVSSAARDLKSYAFGGASGTAVNGFGYASANQPATFPGCTFTVSGHLVSAP